MHQSLISNGEIAREFTARSVTVAIAATIGLMASYSTIGNTPLGLFVVPVTHAFGIGRGTFGLLIGLSSMLGASLTPLAGKAMDRFGIRRVMLPGIALFGAVQLLLSVAPRSVPLLAVLLLWQGAMSAVLSPLGYSKALALWFHRRRGTMLGVAVSIGIGGGTAASVALISALMASGGWRRAYLGTGLYVLIVGALVVAPFLHEPASVERAEKALVPVDLPGLTRREALGTRPIRLLMVFMVSCIGGLTTIMGHGPALLAGRGLDIGPLFLSCSAIGGLFGQLACGILLDRIDSPRVGLPFALATLTGGVTVLHFGWSSDVVLPASVLMGLGSGAEIGLTAYYISRFCGLRAYASIFGVLGALLTLSAGIFPALAGFVFDYTGSYRVMLPVLDVMLALPPLVIFLLPAYRFNAMPLPGQ